MNKGDRVVYKPINWVNGKPKTDNPLYGKKGTIAKAFKQFYYLDVDNQRVYAFSKEIEGE